MPTASQNPLGEAGVGRAGWGDGEAWIMQGRWAVSVDAIAEDCQSISFVAAKLFEVKVEYILNFYSVLDLSKHRFV